MLMPDNPAQFVAEEGEELFKTPRGPKNVSLEDATSARDRVSSRAPMSSCRVILPTPARSWTWNRAWCTA